MNKLFLQVLCGVICLTAAWSANANLISNPGFSSGSSWTTNANTEIGSWGGSDGGCVYVPDLRSGTLAVWQYIPAWKLPSTPQKVYFWDESKQDYRIGADAWGGIYIWGLKTSQAKNRGDGFPGGDDGTDYKMLGGSNQMGLGNGFWWDSSYYKAEVGHSQWNPVTKSNFPQGLLVKLTARKTSGSAQIGAGYDNLMMTTNAPGSCAGDAIVAAATAVPHQYTTGVTLAYNGRGYDPGYGNVTPLWIDPEYAQGYEYEITQSHYRNKFAGFELAPFGDGLYDIDIFDTTTQDWLEVATDVSAEQLIRFSDIAPGKLVKRFRVRGIEPIAELDANGHDFPIGLTFGWTGDVQLQLTALVPEPTSLALLGLGCMGLIRRRRK